MTPLPSAEKELAGLERFLAIDLSPRQAEDAAVQDLRRRAERLATRMANPVRVAVLGLPGSGKSALAGFLAGCSYTLPAPTAKGGALPVILRHGKRQETCAGWWSGIEIPVSGLDLEAAAVHSPDYIELRLPNPILEHISFIDMPGLGEWPEQKEQVRWSASRADVLLWCTHGEHAWEDDEWQLWSLVPIRLQKRSLLVVTHAEAPEIRDTETGVVARLTATTGQRFANVVGIATVAALGAAPSGQVLDAAAWEASGGRALVGALIGSARDVRRGDIAAAHEIIAAGLDALGLRPAEGAPREPARGDAAGAQGRGPGSRPLVHDRSKPRDPEPDAAAGTPAPPDAAPASAAPAGADSAETASAGGALIAFLGERIDALIAYAEAGDDFKDWEFMAQVTELADALSQRIADRGLFGGEDERWIRHQLEDAFVSFSLMQMEPGEGPCRDAARLLLQICRDLAWATTPAEAA